MILEQFHDMTILYFAVMITTAVFLWWLEVKTSKCPKCGSKELEEIGYNYKVRRCTKCGHKF